MRIAVLDPTTASHDDLRALFAQGPDQPPTGLERRAYLNALLAGRTATVAQSDGLIAVANPLLDATGAIYALEVHTEALRAGRFPVAEVRGDLTRTALKRLSHDIANHVSIASVLLELREATGDDNLDDDLDQCEQSAHNVIVCLHREALVDGRIAERPQLVALPAVLADAGMFCAAAEVLPELSLPREAATFAFAELAAHVDNVTLDRPAPSVVELLDLDDAAWQAITFTVPGSHDCLAGAADSSWRNPTGPAGYLAVLAGVTLGAHGTILAEPAADQQTAVTVLLPEPLRAGERTM